MQTTLSPLYSSLSASHQTQRERERWAYQLRSELVPHCLTRPSSAQLATQPTPTAWPWLSTLSQESSPTNSPPPPTTSTARSPRSGPTLLSSSGSHHPRLGPRSTRLSEPWLAPRRKPRRTSPTTLLGRPSSRNGPWSCSLTLWWWTLGKRWCAEFRLESLGSLESGSWLGLGRTWLGPRLGSTRLALRLRFFLACQARYSGCGGCVCKLFLVFGCVNIVYCDTWHNIKLSVRTEQILAVHWQNRQIQLMIQYNLCGVNGLLSN